MYYYRSMKSSASAGLYGVTLDHCEFMRACVFPRLGRVAMFSLFRINQSAAAWRLGQKVAIEAQRALPDITWSIYSKRDMPLSGMNSKLSIVLGFARLFDDSRVFLVESILKSSVGPLRLIYG